MTDKIWHTKIWTWPKGYAGKKWHGATGGITHPSDFESEIFGGELGYGNLFAYLYRRFGPPENGGDGYKELACWYVTTPNERVSLIAKPRTCSGSFGYIVNTEKYPDHRPNENQLQEIDNALKDAMRDLLVPTNVRDVFINAAGIVDDFPKETVEYFKWAGYGVVKEYFEYRFGGDND